MCVCMSFTQMRLYENVFRLKVEPFAIFLHHTIDQLQSADTANIFGRPVTSQEVDYCAVILILVILHSSTVIRLFVSPTYKTYYSSLEWHIFRELHASLSSSLNVDWLKRN